MDTYFVKDADVVAFCLHPEKSHIYYLTEPNDINKQYIIEEDMLTFNIINKFEAIEETAKTNDPYGYNLYFYKKKQYLILTYPSSLITIWDTNSKTLLFKSHAFKKPLERITALALSESYPLMIFSARSQTRLFMTNINEAISSEAAVTFRKLKLSKKVTVNDIKCHPIEAKCAVACNDGVIRTWDLTGLNAMVPILETAGGIPAKRLASMKSIEILKLSLPSVLSVSFSPDGTKLLSCNQQGKILVWDVTNLGEEHTLLASIRLSEKGVLSGAWLNYNGDYRSTRLICYTQEGNIKSLELERNAEKRPDKKGVMWSLRELENIYHTKGEINPDRIDIDPYYQSFLKTHPFSNLVVVNTLKEKKFLKERMIQLKFSLNIKVLVIFDKLDYLLDYPKFAPNIHVPLNQVMFPPNQRSLTYQKEIFYVEDGTLNQLDLSTGKKEIVIEFLKTPQLSDVIRTTKFELRPITLDHVSHYTFLINFQKEKYQVLLIALYNAETNPVTFKLYKEIPCAMSLFLGNTYLHNPPVFILGEDRTTYMVFIDDPSKLDKETIEHINVEARIRDNLNIKIKKVYWTPFRHGYVLIYQTAYDNLLRFSMNRIQSNDILDFRVLTTDYVYKTQYDEDVFDVIWQAKTGYIEEEQYLGAVISWNKITVINENLQQMLTIKMPYFNIKTNMLVNAFWFGYTLFYYTKNHFFYSTLDGKSNCICSFDNYSYKNQILAMMNDRVIFGSKPNILNSKQARQPKYKMEIRFRPIVLNEPVILGYLSLKKIYPDFVPDYNIVKQNLLLIETSHLSTELIKGLTEHKLFNAAWFILGNHNYSQFSIEEKVKLLNKLGHFDQFFEILLPGKHLTDQGEANEVIRNILNNPVFYVEKNLLEKQAEVFINFGEFTKAVQSYDLLQEYQKISSLLSILGEDRWSQTFASNFLKENNSKIFNYNLRAALMIQAKMVHELISLRMAVKTGAYIERCEFKIRDQCSYGTQDFHLNDVKLIDNLKKTLPSHLSEEELPIFEKLKMKYRIEEDPMGDITKLNIPFGETPYSFVYTAPQAGEEDEEKVQPKFTEVFSTTPYQFLGYNCLEMDETKKKQGGAGDFEGAGMDEGMEDTDESGAISLYWRFDEGKGVNVENILGNNLSGTVEFKGGPDAAENVWVPLEDGDPMELEDKWGKKCPPQFAISFRSDLTSIKCSKKTWSPASLNRFTVELWLRPKSEHGVILEIGQGNFVFGFQNLEFVLQVKNSAISLTTENKEMANKEEGDDEGPAAEGGDEETNKIRNNFWNHVAIVYDNSQQKKLTLYLNCVLVKSSEFTLPSDLFKDQNLYLGKEKLNAELTEFRLWTSALSLSEIKEQHRMPLEIVFEKKKEIKVKFKAAADKSATTGLPKPIGLPAPGMLPAPGGNTGLRPPPGSGFPAPEGFSFPAQKAGGIPMPESFATYKEETSPGPKPSSFGIPRPEEDASPVQRPASNSGFGIPRPDDVEPYQSRSISRFDEREEEEKRVSSGGFDDFSRPKAASGFSDFDTHGRERESPSPNNFDQFGSHHHHEEKPASSFDNFGFQSTPAQQASNNFGGFSDFNTAPVTTGGFGGFEKWDNNNNSTSPKPAAQANNFSDFSSFSQTQPQKEEAKSNFNDFGNFNSFDTANSRTPVQNDNNFSGFDSFSPKPADASRNRTSTEAPKRSSIEAARKSRGASEERIRRKSYEAGHHEDEMGDHHHGENPEMSFAQGINAGDITFQDDDYRKNLSRPKDADQKQLAFTDSLYSDLINAEGLDRDQLIKAKDVWVTILYHFQNAEINETVEAIDQAISILKKQCTVCSKLGDKALLKKLQKLIVQLGRYRLGTQLLTGINDMKNQESPSLRKLCYLLIVLYSLKLVYATNPIWLIETAELNLKAKNYKIAHQVYEDLLNSNYYELNDDQKEKIVERLKSLDELPRENNTLQKMNCPSCSQSFGFVGEYSCPECSKDFVLCYQTLSCIDEEGNLKCNACHACFSKTAKQIGERCSVCRMGALFAKK